MMLKKLKIKFVAVNMSIVTLMLVAIFVVLYISTSHRLEFDSLRGPKPGLEPHHPRNEQIEKRFDDPFERQMESFIVDKDPEVFDEFITIAKKATLNNLIRTYLLISVPIFGLFLLVSIILANRMIKPVDETFKKQRQFISDASHELKTPLTVITTNTEMLEDEPGLSVDAKQYIENILTTSNKMKGLVTGLLELAKSENLSDRSNYESINLSELAKRTVLPFEPVFFENELSFSTTIEDEIFITGSETDLSRLIEILLDNAAKYSCPGGDVRLKLLKSGSDTTLSVENTGEEIPEAELELIFDRFYRTNKARTGMDSFGLGLALAKQIVTNHKGKIHATSKEGTNAFTVTF